MNSFGATRQPGFNPIFFLSGHSATRIYIYKLDLVVGVAIQLLSTLREPNLASVIESRVKTSRA